MSVAMMSGLCGYASFTAGWFLAPRMPGVIELRYPVISMGLYGPGVYLDSALGLPPSGTMICQRLR